MSYKILLIEPDVEAGESRRAPLVRAGHQIVVARDSVDGLGCVVHERPDVAVIATGGPDDTIAAACRELRAKAAAEGRTLRLVVVTDVRNDPSERCADLECDAVIDPEASGHDLVQIVATLMGGASGPPAGVTAAAPAAPQPPSSMVDQDELVSALERLDTIMTHKAAGQVQGEAAAEAHAAADTAQQDFAHLAQTVDRDAPAAGAEMPDQDAGTDIDEHLDDVFAHGLPSGSPPRPAVADSPAAPVPAAPPAHATTVEAPTATATVPEPSEVPAFDADAFAESTPPVIAPIADAALDVPSAADRLPAGPPRWLVAASAAIAVVGVVGYLSYALFFRPASEPPATVAHDAAPRPARAEPIVPPFAPPSQEMTEASEGPSIAAPGLAAPAATESEATTAPPIPESVPPAATEPTPATVPDPRPVADTPQASAPAVSPPQPRRPASAPPSQPPAPPQEPVATAAPPETPAVTPPPAKPRPTPAARITPTAPAEQAVPAPPPEPTREIEPVTPAAEAAAPPEPTVASDPAASPPEPPAPTPPPAPVVEPPAVLERVEPTVPRKALKGVEDPVVVLRVLVDEQGRIARVLVDQGIPGSELEAAAVSAVLRWTFRPGTEDGRPVEAWTTATFEYGR